jgi:hypothetical protein
MIKVHHITMLALFTLPHLRPAAQHTNITPVTTSTSNIRFGYMAGRSRY